MKQRYRIVLAEDDAMTRILLRAVFTRFFPDADVTLAANGREALTVAPGADLIVTDHIMPEMTGGQLVQHLRQQGSRIPIVVLSGQTVPDVAPDSYTHLAPKPLPITDLVQLVTHFLQMGAA